MNSISSRIANLRERLALAGLTKDTVVDELNLLQAAIPFIIEAHKYGQANGKDTIQTIHYILEYWWRNQPHIRNPILRSKPRDNFYISCFKCGCCHNGSAVYLVADCSFCRYDNQLPSLSLHFLLDFLAYRTDINVHWWEKLMADYIHDRYYHERRYSGN